MLKSFFLGQFVNSFLYFCHFCCVFWWYITLHKRFSKHSVNLFSLYWHLCLEMYFVLNYLLFGMIVATDTFFQLFFEYFIILPYIIIFGCHFYDYIWQLANSFVWFYLSISLSICENILPGKLHDNKNFENFITNILYSILPKFSVEFCACCHSTANTFALLSLRSSWHQHCPAAYFVIIMFLLLHTDYCPLCFFDYSLDILKSLAPEHGSLLPNYKLQALVKELISKNKANRSWRMTPRADLWLPRVMLLPTCIPSSMCELAPLHS